MVKYANILVTGGTGSFGSTFIKKVMNFPQVKRVVCLSRDEYKQEIFNNDMKSNRNINKLRFFLGDVRDQDRLNFAFRNIDLVIHAAALKQVPKAEYDPEEFIKTNIQGSLNVTKASINNKIKKCILISTDKAVNPVNHYGATKLCAERLFVSSNNITKKNETKFSVVRYGNVTFSRGSVLPILLKQNLEKKPFTITSKEMTRFVLSIDQGVKFVISTINNSKPGEIWIPKLKGIKIIDLAKSINKDNRIKIIGIREGEKIHETLINEESSLNTSEYANHYIIHPNLDDTKVKKNIFNKKKLFSYNSKDTEHMSLRELEKLVKYYA